MVEEHGAEMSSRDRREARRVNATFEFSDTPSSSNRRRVGGTEGGGNGGGDPQPQLAPRTNPTPDNRRSRFGAHLTTEGDGNGSSPGASGRLTPSPPPPSMDPVTAEYWLIPIRQGCAAHSGPFPTDDTWRYSRAYAPSHRTRLMPSRERSSPCVTT
jgi:hypothetical protein